MFIKSAEIFKRHLKKISAQTKISKHRNLEWGWDILTAAQFFELKPFFQLPLETFLLTLRTCSRYLKGASNLVVYASNKIMTVQHTNQNILENNKIMT